VVRHQSVELWEEECVICHSRETQTPELVRTVHRTAGGRGLAQQLLQPCASSHPEGKNNAQTDKESELDPLELNLQIALQQTQAIQAIVRHLD